MAISSTQGATFVHLKGYCKVDQADPSPKKGGGFRYMKTLLLHNILGKKMQFFVPNPLVQVTRSDSTIC